MLMDVPAGDTTAVIVNNASADHCRSDTFCTGFSSVLMQVRVISIYLEDASQNQMHEVFASNTFP
jgi:hypothetical protein